MSLSDTEMLKIIELIDLWVSKHLKISNGFKVCTFLKVFNSLKVFKGLKACNGLYFFYGAKEKEVRYSMIEGFEIIEDINMNGELEIIKKAKLDHFHFVIFWNKYMKKIIKHFCSILKYMYSKYCNIVFWNKCIHSVWSRGFKTTKINI